MVTAHTLRRQRQANISESETSLAYKMRTARATQKNFFLKKTKTKTNKLKGKTTHRLFQYKTLLSRPVTGTLSVLESLGPREH